MQLFIVRWPNGRASLVAARDHVELEKRIGEVGDPAICDWEPYEGDVWFDLAADEPGKAARKLRRGELPAIVTAQPKVGAGRAAEALLEAAWLGTGNLLCRKATAAEVADAFGRAEQSRCESIATREAKIEAMKVVEKATRTRHPASVAASLAVTDRPAFWQFDMLVSHCATTGARFPTADPSRGPNEGWFRVRVPTPDRVEWAAVASRVPHDAESLSEWRLAWATPGACYDLPHAALIVVRASRAAPAAGTSYLHQVGSEGQLVQLQVAHTHATGRALRGRAIAALTAAVPPRDADARTGRPTAPEDEVEDRPEPLSEEPRNQNPEI